MSRVPSTPWPTGPGSVFFDDVASAATMSRAVRDGRVQRIAPGVYTADLSADPTEVVARNRWAILARLVPDAMIADRSAATQGMPVGGVLTIVSQKRSSDLVLPGLIIAPRRGHKPLGDDLPWTARLRITSEARTLVDNVALSRSRAGKPARTLSRSELEDWLVRLSQRRPEDWLSVLRQRALEICVELEMVERGPTIEDIVGAVAGTRLVHAGAGRLLAARSAGLEYDPDRAARFDALAGFLSAIPPELDIPHSLFGLPNEESTSLPFFEAYFSNFIEGTEFSVEEAELIVATRVVPPARPEDAHDVLGTFDAVADTELRAAVPATADEMLDLLARRHTLVMSGRPEKHPGQFKLKPNQAGSYVFVAPSLVEGTLSVGFNHLSGLPTGFARAAYTLFLISEVHPYDDGNGRVARAAMCAELSAAHQARLVIPIVFRNEYLTALRSLSRDGRAALYVRTLAMAWRWTAAMPWQDRAAVDSHLATTNAMVDSTDAERSGIQLQLP